MISLAFLSGAAEFASLLGDKARYKQKNQTSAADFCNKRVLRMMKEQTEEGNHTYK